MYAVIKTGGKQERVSPGDQLRVEKLPCQAGESFVFDQVLLVNEGENTVIGTPFIEGGKVVAQVLRHGKAKKIMVIKFKRRKNFHRKKGHRQEFSLIKIDSINI